MCFVNSLHLFWFHPRCICGLTFSAHRPLLLIIMFTERETQKLSYQATRIWSSIIGQKMIIFFNPPQKVSLLQAQATLVEALVYLPVSDDYTAKQSALYVVVR